MFLYDCSGGSAYNARCTDSPHAKVLPDLCADGPAGSAATGGRADSPVYPGKCPADPERATACWCIGRRHDAVRPHRGPWPRFSFGPGRTGFLRLASAFPADIHVNFLGSHDTLIVSTIAYTGSSRVTCPGLPWVVRNRSRSVSGSTSACPGESLFGPSAQYPLPAQSFTPVSAADPVRANPAHGRSRDRPYVEACYQRVGQEIAAERVIDWRRRRSR